MTRPRRIAPWLAAALALAALATAPAGAQERALRVAVLPFRGPRAEITRADVIEALQGVEGVQLVPGAQIENAAAALGVSLRRPDRGQLRRLARQLRADALVRGTVSRKRRRRRREWILTVSVHAADGSRVGTARWRGRTPGALRAVRRSGRRRFGPLLEEARQHGDGASTGDASRPWYGSAPAATPQGPGATPGTTTVAQPPEVPPSEPLDEEEEANEEAGESVERKAPALSLALQAGTLSRSLSTDVQVLQCVRERNCDAADPFGGPTFTERREYRSGGLGHGELGLAVALFPGAFARRQPLPWLGVYGEFSHSVGLRTTGPACGDRPDCPASATVGIATSQLQLRLGARLRALPRLGEDRLARLELDAGWGRLAFLFDRDDLASLARSHVVPSFDYQWVELAARAGIELVPRVLEVKGEAGLRLVYTPGEQAREVWGGQASSSGWSAAAALRLALDFLAEGAFAEARFEWAAFSTTFSGHPGCYREPCESVYALWEPWPTSGGRTTGLTEPVPDRFMRLALRIGWSWAPGGDLREEEAPGAAPRPSPSPPTSPNPISTPPETSGGGGAWWAR